MPIENNLTLESIFSSGKLLKLSQEYFFPDDGDDDFETIDEHIEACLAHQYVRRSRGYGSFHLTKQGLKIIERKNNATGSN